jgi:hypothetical protein
MSCRLSEKENFSLGVVAAFIEGVILQPTLYWKNARAQKLPFSINPRVIYRGTAASLYNEMQMMGLQFGLTGIFKQFNSSNSSRLGDYFSAFFGGSAAAIFASPVELVMIQQQRHGGSIFSTLRRVSSAHGPLKLFRGVGPAMIRDALYVSGFLGITPILQEHFMEDYSMPALQAGLWASIIGGICAAVPSHPLDLVKTCMQGDLERVVYAGPLDTCRQLWKEGRARRLFDGCFWRSFNIVATVYIANECRLRLPIHLFGSEY